MIGVGGVTGITTLESKRSHDPLTLRQFQVRGESCDHLSVHLSSGSLAAWTLATHYEKRLHRSGDGLTVNLSSSVSRAKFHQISEHDLGGDIRYHHTLNSQAYRPDLAVIPIHLDRDIPISLIPPSLPLPGRVSYLTRSWRSEHRRRSGYPITSYRRSRRR